jgi:hypothetical protein
VKFLVCPNSRYLAHVPPRCVFRDAMMYVKHPPSSPKWKKARLSLTAALMWIAGIDWLYSRTIMRLFDTNDHSCFSRHLFPLLPLLSPHPQPPLPPPTRLPDLISVVFINPIWRTDPIKGTASYLNACACLLVKVSNAILIRCPPQEPSRILSFQHQTQTKP